MATPEKTHLKDDVYGATNTMWSALCVCATGCVQQCWIRTVNRGLTHHTIKLTSSVSSCDSYLQSDTTNGPLTDSLTDRQGQVLGDAIVSKKDGT